MKRNASILPGEFIFFFLAVKILNYFLVLILKLFMMDDFWKLYPYS